MSIRTLGLDIAKHVFQVYGVDGDRSAVLQRRLRRADVVAFFANLEPCVVGIEACQSSHYWARELTKVGHDVRVIPTQYVKPYVRGGKNDVNDARAIYEAVSRPGMRFVRIKSADQQALQALHRMRERLIHERTAKANQIRGFLAEEGVVFPQGVSRLRTRLVDLLDDLDRLSPLLRRMVTLFLEQLRALEEWLAKLNSELQAAFAATDACQRLAEIRGVGPVIATAVVATIGDARGFKNGRQFAAWVGLTPRQCSSGQRTRLLGITKRGDAYLRTLFVQGARAIIKTVVRHDDVQSHWIRRLLLRRHKHVVAIAVANKLARVIWAVLAKGERFRPPQPVAA